MSQIQVNQINDASGGVLAPISSVMRNRIINGAMVIDQRNSGASVTPTASAQTYTVDRWAFFPTQASKFSVQQNAGSVTPPAGFRNYLGVTSLSSYSVLSSDTFVCEQAIEGFNVYDLGFGTANAQTVTVSFWVRSSLTGTFGGCLSNGGISRAYPFSYTITTANTWEQKSITIPGDTSGTWATNNTSGMFLRFGLGSGSTYTASAGAWGAGNIVQPTGTVSVVGTNAATWYVTGCQLERGTQATSFEYRQYGTELALCQRYFLRLSSTRTFHIFGGACWQSSSSSAVLAMPTPTSMRSSPLVTYSGGLLINGSTANGTVSAISVVDYNPSSIGLVIATNAVLVAGQAGALIDSGSNNSTMSFSAEL